LIVYYRNIMSDEDEMKQQREKVDNHHIRPNPSEQRPV
jgi:hypothetical protein